MIASITDKPSISSLAAQRLPIILPWHRESTIYPGQLLHSRSLQDADPWSTTSPFKTEIGHSNQGDLVYSTIEAGGTGTFRSNKTVSTISRQDHESYAFTGTVEAVIAKASGKLQYDRHLSNNKDVSELTGLSRIISGPSFSFLISCMQSIRSTVESSYRGGSVYLDHIPQLSNEAIITLKYEQGGIEAFETAYGDYYVLGYNIGADHAMTVSTSSRSNSKTEIKTLTAKAEAFLLSVNYTTQTSSTSSSGDADLNVIGFDSLSGTTMNRTSSWGASATLDFNKIQMETSDLLTMGDRIATRVEQRLRDLGLPAGSFSQEKTNHADIVSKSTGIGLSRVIVGKDTCKVLVESGLVIELVLLPVRNLRQVREWMLQDDII